MNILSIANGRTYNLRVNRLLKIFCLVLAIALAGVLIWERDSETYIEVTATPTSNGLATATPIATETATPLASVTTGTICSRQPEITLLLVGTDYRRRDYFAGLADVIRIAHIDFSIPQVNVIALPRDLLIDLPVEYFDVEGPFKLSQAYFFGTPSGAHYSGEDDGAGALAIAIEQNFGITIDHYLVIDFAAFRRFINAIGGIEVYLPTSIIDKKFSFPQGEQHLNGQEALVVARARKQYGEFFRIDSQSIIMDAIFKRLKEPVILFQFPSLLIEFREAVLMDFSPVDIYSAFCLLSHLTEENIRFHAPDEDLFTEDREFLPTLANRSFILRWDAEFLAWIEERLASDQ